MSLIDLSDDAPPPSSTNDAQGSPSIEALSLQETAAGNEAVAPAVDGAAPVADLVDASPGPVEADATAAAATEGAAAASPAPAAVADAGSADKGKAPEAAAAGGLDLSKFAKYPRMPHGSEKSSWSDAPGEDFNVRSKGYMTAKKKEKSQEAVARLEHIDLVDHADVLVNYSNHPDGFLKSSGLFSEPGRFYFVAGFSMKPKHCFCVWSVDVEELGRTSPQLSPLFDQFMRGEDDALRKARFKVIPRVVKGAWMVRKMVGEVPALLANKLTCEYHRGDNYMEINCDVLSSKTATSLVKLIQKSAASLVMEIAIVIQAESDDHLPERVLAACTFNHLDFMNCTRPWTV